MRATDAAGNQGSAATRTWTVDTTAPATTITASPPKLSKSADAELRVHRRRGRAASQCALDAGRVRRLRRARPRTPASPTASTPSRCVATDPAGNSSPRRHYTWTVDTTAPQATISAGPQGLTGSADAEFEFAADEQGATLACALDEAAFTGCDSGAAAYTGLADGEHTFQVRATDAAGNQGSAATRTWTVDTTAPATTITEAPPATTTSTSATFEFTSNENGSSFECALDDSGFGFAPCSSGEAFTVALGLHQFQVRAQDEAGNVGSAASHSWTVQTVNPTPPETTITAGPSGPTNDTTPTFAFTANEQATFECRVDSETFAACTSPHTTTPPLSQGAHTFQVRATDTAGNLGNAASRTIVVDTVAPETTITSGPSTPTNVAKASLAFASSEEGSSFACALDGAELTTCGSEATYIVEDGSHTLAVVATDAAGNTDSTPASHTWTVDTVAPATTITAGPSGPPTTRPRPSRSPPTSRRPSNAASTPPPSPPAPPHTPPRP